LSFAALMSIASAIAGAEGATRRRRRCRPTAVLSFSFDLPMAARGLVLGYQVEDE
jgi:hypothetical protein